MTLCSCRQVPAFQVQQRTVNILQIQVPAIRQSGGHSSCATDRVARFSDDREMPTIKKIIPGTVHR